MRARVVEDDRGRRQAQEACLEPCAIERGMRIIGGKWMGSILWHLKDEPVRFNDLARMIGGASKKMIFLVLKDLLQHLNYPTPSILFPTTSSTGLSPVKRQGAPSKSSNRS